MIRLALAVSLASCVASAGHSFVLGGKILEQNGSGEFVKLETTTPFSVGADTFDDDNLYAFDEDQNIELQEPVRVDIGGVNSVIPQGTVVASHYVFFDSIASVQYGYVDFDAPILGLAVFQDTMSATDYLANTSVNYISIELRGLEQGDYVWIDEDDPHRLWVYWAGSSPGDYIRVFTEESHTAFTS